MSTSTPRDVERLLRSEGYSRKAEKIAVSAMRLQGMFKEKPKKNIITRIYRAITGE